MFSNTEFNHLKLKLDQLYLSLSGGKVNGETVFSKKVTFGSGDKVIKIYDGKIEGLDSPEGHTYDLEPSSDKSELLLKEDGTLKDTIPVNTNYVGTRARWNTLTVAEKAKYLTMDFTDDGGLGDISDEDVTFTSSDVVDADANSWTVVSPIASGTTLNTLFSRVSQMFKNVRYIYKILGTTDLSAIGGGTVTDILKTANTNITNLKSGKSNLLVRRGKSATYSLSANGGSAFSITDTLSGYTCIYAIIVGSDFGDYCPINQSGISLGNGTVTVSGYVKSFHSSAVTLMLRLESLWVKNT